nr:MAG: hypothetical protein AM324_05370 [Candidatus Thorarchaeota archaeon SMTZ1-83]
MDADKWIVVKGQVFRLERVFNNLFGALLLQKELSRTRETCLKRTGGGIWAVYWRPKKKRIECTPRVQIAA